MKTAYIDAEVKIVIRRFRHKVRETAQSTNINKTLFGEDSAHCIHYLEDINLIHRGHFFIPDRILLFWHSSLFCSHVKNDKAPKMQGSDYKAILSTLAILKSDVKSQSAGC